MSSMTSPLVKKIFLGSIALSGIIAIGAPALAVKPLLPVLCKAFDLKEEEMSCKACHTYDKSKNEKPGEKNINAFAKDFLNHPDIRKIGELENDRKFSDAEQAVIIKVFKEIARYDSDGDGASNVEEMKLGSNPGDPKKTPDAAELAKYRKEHPDTTPIAKPAKAEKSGEKSKRKKEDD